MVNLNKANLSKQNESQHFRHFKLGLSFWRLTISPSIDYRLGNERRLISWKAGSYLRVWQRMSRNIKFSPTTNTKPALRIIGTIAWVYFKSYLCSLELLSRKKKWHCWHRITHSTINVTRPKNIICLLTKTHYVTLEKYIYGYITLAEEIFYQLTASDVLPLEPVQVKADPEESLPLPEYASEILEFVCRVLNSG